MRKVVDWISWSAAEDKKDSCGGLGGFFVHGMRWKDYIDCFTPEVAPYLEALREEIVRIQLRCGGDEHQAERVPLFDDGTVGQFSYRAWGDLCAAVWSEHENKDYQYMDFYMTCVMKPREENGPAPDAA